MPSRGKPTLLQFLISGLTRPVPDSTSPSTSASWRFTRLGRVVTVERPKQFLVEDILARDPGALLRAVALPLHQVLPSSAPSMDVQDPLDHVGGRAVDEPVGGGSLVAGESDSSDSPTGLICETWNVGWTLMNAGNLR